MVVVGAASIIRRSNRWPGSPSGLALVAGIIAFVAQHQVASFTTSRRTPTTRSAPSAALLGYLVIAVASAASALDSESSLFRESIDRALAWRPGLPLSAPVPSRRSWP